MRREPWFECRESIDWLAWSVHPAMDVFEWGCGGSTLWFADRVHTVTSVEHNHVWWERVQAELYKQRTINVVLQWIAAQDWPGDPADGTGEQFRAYVDEYEEPADLVLIDGRARVACAERVAAIGGDPLIFLDNCDRKEYAPIWETHLDQVARVGNLMLLRRHQ